MNTKHHFQQTWTDKKDYLVLVLVFTLLPIASQAGGLGIAAITALGGGLTLIGLAPSKLGGIIKNTPKPVWAVMALLIYGLISSLWSPYQSNRDIPNPMILLLGVPLYLLFSRAFISHNLSNTVWLRRIWFWGTIGSAIAILFDLVTGFSISLAIDPVSTGENLDSHRGDTIQNLGHGVAVLTLFFPAIAVTLWQQSVMGRIGAAMLAIIIFAGGFYAGMSASVVALVFAILFMSIASQMPKIAITVTHLIGAIALLGAPLVGFVATKMSTVQLARLPFSWEERIHNWRYIFDKMQEHPVFGHGFDAVRTFADKHTIRGFDDRAIVSLHPHNAGLHIWVELGLVGILISCVAIYLSHKVLKTSNMVRTPMAIVVSGTGIAAIVNASLTFGVWQDWWWAAIIIAFSTSALIPYTTENI